MLVLPTYWQGIANKVANLCQHEGNTLPIRWQNKHPRSASPSIRLDIESNQYIILHTFCLSASFILILSEQIRRTDYEKLYKCAKRLIQVCRMHIINTM